MATDSQKRQLLRRAALSAAMLLIVAPAAFADPPGNLFRDFEHSAPVVASAPALPRQVSVPNAESYLRAEQEKHACAVVLGLDRSEDPMPRASGVLREACLNRIKRKWLRATDSHVAKLDSIRAPRHSRPVW
jgi:hypothetical protein